MAEALPSDMTVDAFLAWAMERPGRYELENGRVVAMAPERLGHVRARTASFDALRTAVARAKLPCEALPDGVAVRIDARTLYEPDALVFCGHAPPRDALAVVEPMIVVEVVSPSTGSRDHNEKIVGYFAVPSIQHYLTVRSSSTTPAAATRPRRASSTAARCASTRRGSTSPSRTCSAACPRRSAPGLRVPAPRSRGCIRPA